MLSLTPLLQCLLPATNTTFKCPVQVRSKQFARAALIVLGFCLAAPGMALDGMADLAQEQAQEKAELEDMRKELRSIKGEVQGAMGAMSQLNMNAAVGRPVREYHLFAKEAQQDCGTTSFSALTYNGKIPGPEIHAAEGESLKIVLHNQLKVPTSLHFHGMILPHKIDGLPRSKGQAERFVKPGESHIYQFPAGVAGTYFYHPQIVQQDQRYKGMYGALVVHSRLPGRPIDKDIVLVVSKQIEAGGRFYLVNGMTAPHIPALEVKSGERIRLRVINATDEVVPLHLGGHRFEVTAINGSDPLEPKVVRDTVSIMPADRIDLEFMANNPGVWSLASELPQQNTYQGKFPGGIAVVVRYNELTD